MQISNEELVKLIKNNINVKANMELLYLQNTSLLRSAAKVYENIESIEDLMQIAYLGLYNAVQQYDAEKGTKFSTFAFKIVQWEIIRYIENNGYMVRIPIYIRSKIAKYKRYRHDYFKEYGTYPTDDIICFMLNVSKEELDYLKLWSTDLSSLDMSVSHETNDITLADTLASPENLENDVIDKIYNDEIKTSVWAILREYLTERENSVIVDHYKNNLPLRQIAEKENLSNERIRQIQNAGLEKLRKKARKELMERCEILDANLYATGLGNYARHNYTSQVENLAMKRIEYEKMYSF